MTSISKVTNYFNENAEALAIEIVEGVLHRMQLVIPEWEKEQAITMYIEFFGFLGESLFCEKDSVPKDLMVWSKKNGEREASSGGRISEIIERYSTTRNIFTELMTKISLHYELSVEETTMILKRINSMLDLSINETLYAFERQSDRIAKKTKRVIAELSATIVPIHEDIAVLPLVGSIDTYRATFILEKVVPKIVEQEIEYLIADFSGILTIDLEVANYLYSIENILRLLGVKTIVTGLRPELAQIVVKGGIDMSSIQTFATVKQALKSFKKNEWHV